MDRKAKSLNTENKSRTEVIRVGVIHSLSDSRSDSRSDLSSDSRGEDVGSETLIKEATLMAIAEINRSGGILGRTIDPIVVDIAPSDQNIALQTRALITELEVKNLFGCGTSSNRKSVIPLLVKTQSQLWYPYSYEGLECSPNIFYTGTCPNQVVQPAIDWLLQHKGDRLYLIGTDGIYSRTVNKIIRAQLKLQNGLLLGEDYVPRNITNYRDIIAKIKHIAPTTVVITLSLENAVTFLRQYAEAGITAAEIPVLALRFSDLELRQLGDRLQQDQIELGAITGHLASANYFQSLDTSQNQDFLQKVAHWFEAGQKPLPAVHGTMQSAYSQVFLWKQAVESAQTFDVIAVRQAIYGQSFDSPAGKIVCDRNQHIWTACRIAEISSVGNFEILHTIDPIKPMPWLGVEDLPANTSTVAIELLADITQGIQQSWQLEKDAQDLEMTIAELLGRGHGKGRNQLAPEITRAVMSKLFNANQRLLKTQADLLNVEGALRDANELLEQRIEQRTIQLQKTIKRLQNEATDRQQAEMLLRESQQRFSAIADNVPGVVYRAILHPDGEVSMPYISPRTQEIFGISVEEFTEHLEWVFDMAHPEDRAELNEIVQNSAEALSTFEHEYRVSSLFEKVKWVRIISQPHRHENGDTVWDGVIIDISHQKQIEESLRQAEEKYRSIFERAIEGIFQAQPDGCYTNANPALANIYGYETPSDLLTKVADDPYRLFTEPERYQDLLHQISTNGAVNGFEALVYKSDRSIIWILINAKANYDQQGNFISYEGLVQDITERKQTEQALKAEQEKSENLLLNILPKAIVSELKLGHNTIASRSDNVTILFADIVDFTALSTQVSPNDLVTMLNEIFSSFDLLADRLGLEKIKTIGDAYMVVGGLPTARADHAEAIAEMALAMQRAIAQFKRGDDTTFRLRIGINTGAVVAGVIGIRKFIYDLWGDAVNIASRMESHGLAGGIQVTQSTYDLLQDKYSFWYRGKVFIKGRGEMDTYMLLDRKFPMPSLEIPELNSTNV
ncbi:transporter substrate-binding protein [Pseudanabaena sp. UWO310]|uniref:transporter substrate-binding protein n=1 Tax=Pseudanabaena sp. UWO310 TaxID=2480795 RepID=UPI00115ACEB8|nr:transporter substrate-binding protein [Pseudanabaena sp. UWO310]TYQ26585.1 transporter substrate-binding protein [Pseudanabaena sp. UWO310]